ncbi:MAG: hypothetical protein RL701_3505 [Pseudomonadota bacterium]
MYAGVGSTKTTVTPVDLRLFVQDIKLLRADGTGEDLELELREPWQSSHVALLDFEDGHGSCIDGTPDTNMTITGSVPDDVYTGVSFSNSVPEDLNHLEVLQLEGPLQTFYDLSWGPVGGFHFAQIALAQVAAAPNQPYGHTLLHMGSAGCADDAVRPGNVQCMRANRNQVVLEDFDPATQTIVLDIAPIFAKTDMTAMAECHSTDDACKPMFTAFGVNFGSGSATKSQTVYTVE